MGRSSARAVILSVIVAGVGLDTRIAKRARRCFLLGGLQVPSLRESEMGEPTRKLKLVTLRDMIRQTVANGSISHAYRDAQLTATSHQFAAAMSALDPETATREDLAAVYDRFGYLRVLGTQPLCSSCGAAVERVVEIDPEWDDTFPLSVCADCVHEMLRMVSAVVGPTGGDR